MISAGGCDSLAIALQSKCKRQWGEPIISISRAPGVAAGETAPRMRAESDTAWILPAASNCGRVDQVQGAALIVGTTEVPQQGDPGAAACSAQEQAYLLDAYNRYFAGSGGPARVADVVWSFAGVRALQDHGERKPSRLTRRPAASEDSKMPTVAAVKITPVWIAL